MLTCLLKKNNHIDLIPCLLLLKFVLSKIFSNNYPLGKPPALPGAS
jgi:hypothetical protein